MYYGEQTHVDELGFIESDHYVSFPFKVDSTTVGVTNGILPAGSIIPSNDAKAKAVTINDVDVSNGPEMVGGIVDGFINAKRIPEAPAAEAITALKKISFSNLEEA